MTEWLAAVALTAGAICLYLAAPHQALLRTIPSRRPLRRAGVIALLVALALLLAAMGPATAVFTWTTGLMLVWSIAPIVVRWLRYRKAAE